MTTTVIGYLPPGIHIATLDEIEARFGRESEIRRSQMESLRWLVDLARQAGILRLVINGSFATEVHEPNDVDCVLLIDPEKLNEAAAGLELRLTLPFLDIDLVDQPDFDTMVNRYYATDRSVVPKGMLEVLLWH